MREILRILIFLAAIGSIGAITVVYILFSMIDATVTGDTSLSRRQSGKRIVARISCIIIDKVGGSAVKLCQILSLRPDLISTEAAETLSFLTDRVPSRIHERNNEPWIKDMRTIFREVESEPYAVGSLAQVHKAWLNCHAVALKRIKPRARDQVLLDSRLLNTLAPILGRTNFLGHLPVREVVTDFALTLKQQCDFRREARLHASMYDYFRHDEMIVIPRLHVSHCCDEMLVSDWINLSSDHVTSPNICTVRLALKAVFEMILELGIVHCDLHQGNLYFLRDGRIVILDMGYCVELADFDVYNFQELFFALSYKDAIRLSDVLIRASTSIDCLADKEKLINDVEILLDRTNISTAGSFRVSEFVNDIFSIQKANGIIGGHSFALAVMALFNIEGILLADFPELDFIAELTPHLRNVVLYQAFS